MPTREGGLPGEVGGRGILKGESMQCTYPHIRQGPKL